jgi:serine/threonine protein phosphatase PrpC
VKKGRWSWIGACSIGTSHLASGTSCDDAGACVEIGTQNGSTLVAVVSDGAGSASLSKIGSHIVAAGFCRSALRFARAGGRPRDLDKEVAGEWLDDLRDRIGQASLRENSPRRSFAATLERRTLSLNQGDFRRRRDSLRKEVIRDAEAVFA